MQQLAEKDERVNASSLVPPKMTAVSNSAKKAGLISRPSSIPRCTYPKVVEHARRASTRAVLKLTLGTLQQFSAGTGPVNICDLARATGYHRKTVARALAFGIRFHVIERVDNYKDFPSLAGQHPGKPQVYKSLWKHPCASGAPSLKKSFKVQALASTKTGLCPTRKLRMAAITHIRLRLREAKQPRLTSAYGKYVWSKAATVAGISLLVRTAASMINERTKTLPVRDAFAVVVQNINLACRSLDATERYLATLKREALPDDIDDLFKKPTVANMDNYVATHHSSGKRSSDITRGHYPVQPQPELGLLDESSNFLSQPKESKPEGSNEKVRVTNPECAKTGLSFSTLPDGLLQRWRTLIRRLTEDDPDVDARPLTTADDDRARPRAGPHGQHGGTVPRPFGPGRARRPDDELPRGSTTRPTIILHRKLGDQQGGLRTTFPPTLKTKTTEDLG